ncbi:MAG: hypothetical protein IPN33_20850 [Saprospiraceae bacterium]|nr:hypothetical protein [Saprospiraceae bacterium]
MQIATDFVGDYFVAYDNLNKVYYNAAQQQYQSFLEDSLDIEALPGVQQLFRRATRPLADYTNALAEVNLEALHGVGLIHFYLDQRDSATAYYTQLLALTDSSFFKNLRYAPNLETLLGIRASRILDVRVLEGRNGELPVVVEYYYDPGQYSDLRLDLAPLDDKGAVPRGFTIAGAVARPGQGVDTLVLRKPLRLDADLRTDSLRVRLITPRTRTAVAQLVIAHTQTWAAQPNKLRLPTGRNIDNKKNTIQLPDVYSLNIQLVDANTKERINNNDARVAYTLGNDNESRAAIALRNGDFRIESTEKTPSGALLP